MNNLQRLERWIFYLTALRIIEEMACAITSVLWLIKGRSDMACYFLLASIWIGGQLIGARNEFSNRYNQILDDQERRGRI